MMISVRFTLLFFWLTQDFASCVHIKVPVDVLTVALGDSLTLNCTYNCSSGFVRGFWSKASENSGCRGIKEKKCTFCTASLHLSNVTAEDLKNYTCYTEATDDVQLPKKTERIVLLQLQGETHAPNWTLSPKTETTNASFPAKPKYSNGAELTGIKVLAAVSVAVATVLTALAVFLCLNRNKLSWNCKGEPVVSRSGSPVPPHSVHSPVNGLLSTQSDRVTLRIPTPDNESDTEVPYADIMITVRGVSTPELNQVGYTPGDQKEWSHLQASRSADRLHVPHPREVSRKMSTNSEYAVITYA
ncbi:uncharacterized protein LOC115572613 isoform X1 [Sparus aurata]|uniref:uncharacterized protein LOC115572613 isoform X1 n=1 Tax=Sparus aurata TaxID=8175 RepID=UPI0011C1A1A4|nr:uncharacterized protein LOC115572613 isoform X1 [Sparus aurata]